ncbi:MAG: hypothetical protein HYS25_13695 [Ignavibacteriales bacterium]|nr:hypothetical protein [Ignavibacteriales bacterium]
MARRRMIDPGIWDSAYEKSWSANDFLVMVAAISAADDEGKGKVSMIKRNAGSMISDKKFQNCLQNLSDSIQVYEISSEKLFSLTNWKIYQTINRPSPSKYPPPRSNNNNSLDDITHRTFNDNSMNDNGTFNDRSLPIEVSLKEEKRKEVEQKLKEDQNGTAASDVINSQIEKEELRYIPNFEDITEIKLSIRRLFKRFAKKEKLDTTADLDPVISSIFDQRKQMTREICWKVVVQSFVVLYQAERTDTGYLLGILRRKKEEKFKEIQSLKNNGGLPPTTATSKEQSEEDKKYVADKTKEYLEFYKIASKNPGFFSRKEEREIEEAFKIGSFITLAFYLEPKIEAQTKEITL